MSKKELKRYKVISQWIEGYITGKQAAELLSLSLRQVYRLKKRVLEEDENGVIHKNRGRSLHMPYPKTAPGHRSFFIHHYDAPNFHAFLSFRAPDLPHPLRKINSLAGAPRILPICSPCPRLPGI
ncbi:helix-turn-helix domain-containing protein [Caldibacillus debilis]|uniref:helix-turn-helix domain-containing protein n=1 Tax=Caldibacillus debilis TaxID=301148 RepID=UPI002FD9D64C